MCECMCACVWKREKDSEKVCVCVALSWSDASFREQWNILLSLLVGFVGMCEREDFSAMSPTPKRCRLHAICLPLHSSTCQTCLFSLFLSVSLIASPFIPHHTSKGHRRIKSSTARLRQLKRFTAILKTPLSCSFSLVAQKMTFN